MTLTQQLEEILQQLPESSRQSLIGLVVNKFTNEDSHTKHLLLADPSSSLAPAAQAYRISREEIEKQRREEARPANECINIKIAAQNYLSAACDILICKVQREDTQEIYWKSLERENDHNWWAPSAYWVALELQKSPLTQTQKAVLSLKMSALKAETERITLKEIEKAQESMRKEMDDEQNGVKYGSYYPGSDVYGYLCNALRQMEWLEDKEGVNLVRKMQVDNYTTLLKKHPYMLVDHVPFREAALQAAEQLNTTEKVKRQMTTAAERLYGAYQNNGLYRCIPGNNFTEWEVQRLLEKIRLNILFIAEKVEDSLKKEVYTTIIQKELERGVEEFGRMSLKEIVDIAQSKLQNPVFAKEIWASGMNYFEGRGNYRWAAVCATNAGLSKQAEIYRKTDSLLAELELGVDTSTFQQINYRISHLQKK